MDSPLAAPIGRVVRQVGLLGFILAVTSAMSAGAAFAAVDDPPAPDGPVGVVALLRWCWAHRDAQRYRDLFTADYQFVPGSPDSPWGREDELRAAAALFGPGTATQAGATNISLEFLSNALPGTLSQPDKPYPLHQQILMPILMHIDRGDGSTLDAGGLTMFYLVRGDVAPIPPEMQARGIVPDPHRWYVERWEDLPEDLDVDHAPVFRLPPPLIAPVGQPLTMNVTVVEPDGEDLISLSATVPAGASFTSSPDHTEGQLSWTPSAADTGVHFVTFTASSRLSASASTNLTIHVNQTPKAVLTVTPESGNPPLLVRLDASASRDADGMVRQFHFDFGDGTTFTTDYPLITHWYEKGRWTPRLTVTDNDGGMGSTTATVVAGRNTPPVASLTYSPSSGRAPLLVSFNAANSSDRDGHIVGYQLDFGDGASQTLVAPFATTHTYALGSHTAVLTVTDDEGAPSTTSATTIAYGDRPPLVSAPAKAVVLVGSSLAFSVTVSDADGDAVSSLVARGVPAGAVFLPASDFTSGRLTWTPTAADTGVYPVTFVARNALADSMSTKITVGPHPPDRPPLVTAPASMTAKVGLPLSINVIASDPDGDAITSLSASPLGSAVFRAAADNRSGDLSWTPTAADLGDYGVTFTAANALFATAWTAIHVGPANEPPSGTLTARPLTGSEPLVVDFSAATFHDPDGQIVRYRFDFGDGSFVVQDGPTARHTYMAGEWRARVDVLDELGATGFADAIVSVAPTALTTAATDVVARFATAWRHRSLEEYRRLLTGDFQFEFAPGDSAGDPYPGRAWGRADELLAVGRLFAGGNGAELPAISLSLQFLENPLVGTSFVPGHGYPWHVQVLVPSLSLDVMRGSSAQLHAEGKALFSVVRGDSAHLPQELIDLGVHPDSTQWYVEGWRDMTLPGTGPNHPPVAAIAMTPATGVDPLTVWVDASRSRDDDGMIVSYRFDFGDGVTITRAEPFVVHTFLAGLWTVRVTAIDDRGAESTSSLTINVWAAGSQPNLARNPSFETDTKFWNSYAGSLLQRVDGGHDGVIGLQITGPPAINGSFGVNDSPDMVRWTLGPGIRYRYTAWVRSPSSHGLAKMRVTEYLIAGGAKLGMATSLPVTLTPNWQQLSVDYTTTAANSTLDFQVRDFPIEPSEVFVADDIAVRNVTSQGAGTGMAEGIDDLDGSGLVAMAPRLVPSPIHDSGMLRFMTSRPGTLRVEILDLAGRRIRRLMDEKEAPAGLYELPIGRTSQDGIRLGAGVYFWRIQSREATKAGRFVMLP
jgi:PKD repeat protein